MTEITTTTDAVTEIANRPLILDEYPMDDGSVAINMRLREGDELATMRVTEEVENDDEEIQTIEIDAFLTGDELFRLALAAGTALVRLGERQNLVGLIQDLVAELGGMK